MAKFQIKPTIGTQAYTVRLGAGDTAGDRLGVAEVGKPVKLVAESRYDLCAAGDAVEGFVVAVEPATADGFSIGTIQTDGYYEVTFDGSQEDGTGAIAVGDLVVAGATAAKGTPGPAKVRKATAQTAGLHNWRVVSLGAAGTGAVGTVGVIERV